MEEIKKEQPGEFAFSSLRIRTMQDDLKKHVPQADLPAAPSPAPKPQTSPPTPAPKPSAPPPAPKETIMQVPEQAPVPKIFRVPPEPPPLLPSEPVAPSEPIAPLQEVEPAPSPIAPEETAPIEPPAPSVLKLQSDLIYKEVPKPEQPVERSRRMKFGLMFGVPAVIVILGIFAFLYFRFWQAPKPLCAEGQITEECRCGEQSEETKTTGFCCNNLWADFDCALTKEPEPLIPSINELLTINAQGDTADEVISDIKNSEVNISDEGARIVALRLNESPPRYATLEDLIDIFGIVLPEDLKTNNQAFNLLVYTKPVQVSSTTTSSTPADLLTPTASSTPETLASSTPETRLVLILGQKNKSALEQIMSDWETTMLADMKPIIMGEPAASATSEFVSTVYHNGFFRYKNLPIKTTTINYTIYQNLVILGTSKNSIFFVYDSLDSNNTGSD